MRADCFETDRQRPPAGCRQLCVFMRPEAPVRCWAEYPTASLCELLHFSYWNLNDPYGFFIRACVFVSECAGSSLAGTQSRSALRKSVGIFGVLHKWITSPAESILKSLGFDRWAIIRGGCTSRLQFGLCNWQTAFCVNINSKVNRNPSRNETEKNTGKIFLKLLTDLSMQIK